ncbi:MAG: aldo/keto reductase, partial [Acidobacteria bacterium]|nr:aldo/keto reductase [Acidobacteriota bacterium]
MNAAAANESRRHFLRNAAGFAALAQQAMAQQNRSGAPPTRRLGRTDEQVSIVGLGGAHIGRAGNDDEAEAIRIMHRAIDGGVTF